MGLRVIGCGSGTLDGRPAEGGKSSHAGDPGSNVKVGGPVLGNTKTLRRVCTKNPMASDSEKDARCGRHVVWHFQKNKEKREGELIFK